MDGRDRDAIEDLFRKLAEVEQRSGPRDAESEAYIRALLARQPSAPYYLAQTVIVQEQALEAAQARIEELEGGGAQRQSGGFLDSLFGGGQSQRQTRAPSAPAYEQQGPWGGGRRSGMGMGGGGFLAGAAQTAMGVAGGVVLGNMLADWLSPDQAAAAGLDQTGGEGSGLFSDAPADDGQVDVADAGGDFGGDFDMGDF